MILIVFPCNKIEFTTWLPAQSILQTLEQTNWVVGGPHGAAARLGMKRSTLQFRMQKLRIFRSR